MTSSKSTLNLWPILAFFVVLSAVLLWGLCDCEKHEQHTKPMYFYELPKARAELTI
jgi:hypothetical protein